MSNRQEIANMEGEIARILDKYGQKGISTAEKVGVLEVLKYLAIDDGRAAIGETVRVNNDAIESNLNLVKGEDDIGNNN